MSYLLAFLAGFAAGKCRSGARAPGPRKAQPPPREDPLPSPAAMKPAPDSETLREKPQLNREV